MLIYVSYINRPRTFVRMALVVPENQDSVGWFNPACWLKWRPTSMLKLAEAESKILKSPGLVKRFRPDLQAKFSDVLEHDDAIFDYIYHCNAQTPSGESAFKAMNKSFGWAKNPMINRVADIPKHVPMTLIYGSRSWMDNGTGYHVKYLRDESYVDVQVIRGAGHHVYADKPLPFNALVSKICESVDRNILPTIRIQNRRPSSSSSTSAETVADKIEDKTEKSVNDD
ncbi:hypothetical protein KUTeg_019524 [Tegillarca granosa]|uniref:Uncharacterized protein n=1 Tax=Tegillarca granosa TaxID=220873 RepID=A0ABQ9ECT2_TEGGR|nr:hypothetical protein KUTeg_019524 [Tegillarca granosa]